MARTLEQVEAQLLEAEKRIRALENRPAAADGPDKQHMKAGCACATCMICGDEARVEFSGQNGTMAICCDLSDGEGCGAVLQVPVQVLKIPSKEALEDKRDLLQHFHGSKEQGRKLRAETSTTEQRK